jgi:creatinine amidohydrolase/Fe(II)-dependent formamide hydrolase-like protein
MTKSVAGKYVYFDLTWPDVNQAVEMKKVILLPVGSTGQHGPHLPLDVDNLLAMSICLDSRASRSSKNPGCSGSPIWLQH